MRFDFRSRLAGLMFSYAALTSGTPRATRLQMLIGLVFVLIRIRLVRVGYKTKSASGLYWYFPRWFSIDSFYRLKDLVALSSFRMARWVRSEEDDSLIRCQSPNIGNISFLGNGQCV